LAQQPACQANRRRPRPTKLAQPRDLAHHGLTPFSPTQRNKPKPSSSFPPLLYFSPSEQSRAPAEGILGATLTPSAVCAMAVTSQWADVRHVGNSRLRTALSGAHRADAMGVAHALLTLPLAKHPYP
jgi:hypothetical protein